MKKKKASTVQHNFELIELIGVFPDASFKRMFTGTLARESLEDGTCILRASAIINEGKIMSMAVIENYGGDFDEKTRENIRNTIEKNLGELCAMKLDHDLHGKAGITIKIAEADYFLN